VCLSTRGAQILGAWAQNFVWWCSNIFSIIIADFPVMCKNVYQFTCTEQKAPGDSDVCWSFRNYGSSIVLLTARIWRWLLDFCKIRGQSLTSELGDLGIYINIFSDNFLVILFILLITDIPKPCLLYLHCSLFIILKIKVVVIVLQ
jgi:hypothetical protein